MTPINNMQVYNAGMRKSMLDKLWWIDKIDESVDTVVDYGCADGTLLSMVHEINSDMMLYGYDFNEDMIDLAAENIECGYFSNNYDAVASEAAKNTSVLVASSVFHEIENYSQDIAAEYNNIFNNKYKYIAIRDLFISERTYGISDPLTVAKIRHRFNYDKLQEFEANIGSIDYNENLLQFFLTYRYNENWDREVRENYFPYTIEQFLNRIPNYYEVVYFEHYTLPFIQRQVFKDFDVQLRDPTHGKILLKLKEEFVNKL